MLTAADKLDWLVFVALVLVAGAIDLASFGSGRNQPSFRTAFGRSVLWLFVGFSFTGYVHFSLGSEPAVDYLVAYLVEKSLSVDNLFVFLVIFGHFAIEPRHQERILFWGVTGALVMRATFILAGSALLHQFHWMIYVFGGFLIFTGLKLVLRKEEEALNPADSWVLKFANRFLRTSDQLDGDRFFTRHAGKLLATPLFVVLLVVEFTDVVFAVDSVPAVLAVTDDLFVVYTSNIFAILGLRALYFLLAGLMQRFHYLEFGLSVILVFIGAKMTLETFIDISNTISLAVVASVLTVATVASLVHRPNAGQDEVDIL